MIRKHLWKSAAGALLFSAAQHVGATWYEDGAGHVVIEVERITPVSDWAVRPADYQVNIDPTMAGSKGDGWLEWTGAQFFGNTKPENQVTGIIAYNFKIDTAGDYTIRLRQKQYNAGQAGDAGNDTFVQLLTGTPVSGFEDFSSFVKSWVQSKTDWSLKTSFEPQHGTHKVNDAIRRHYEPGIHTIRLAGRSPGHSIDRLIICPVGTVDSTIESWDESRHDGAGNLLLFDATEDFSSIDVGEVPYYKDITRDALAINAANTSYRGKFARAEATFAGPSGTYDVTITTMTEEDGESTYRLLVNGVQVGTYQNPRVDGAGDLLSNLHTWTGISINNGDTISVESDTHTNGLIPENGGTAWSRGRWQQIELSTAAGPSPESLALNTPSSGQYGERAADGSFKKWHRVSIAFEGPSTSETATPNPYTDYRLDVSFIHPETGKSYKVPGYYAADGNAGENSANSGSIWRVHFAPDELGIWNYTASFRIGSQVAVSDSPTAGTATSFDGETGSFNVVATDKGGLDMRGKGRLIYDETRYLYHAETGERFIKTGADAPEGFLGYTEFDDTYNEHSSIDAMKSWAAHEQDWHPGDGGWKGTGKGILGAINYLASEGQNVFSFLTYSSGGDTRTVWPHITYQNNRTRFDCSKLDQWEVVFTHGDKMGMYLHFKTQETENDNGNWGLDGGSVGLERKMYYRELIARFGHHMALNWNLGEENSQTQAQQLEMAQYFYDHDPYRHNVVIHYHPDHKNNYVYHLGNDSKLTGASIQTPINDVHKDTLKWITESVANGKPWVVANDEQGPANYANPPDWQADESPTQKDSRSRVIWGNLMAGGAGVELYFGYLRDENDLFTEDFRSRDRLWDYCRNAKLFFNTYLPFWEMENANSLIGNTTNGHDKYCFAKSGEVYAVYLANGGTTTLDLTGVSGTFPVYWFNPRDGGNLQLGSVTSVSGGSSVSLGNPPTDTSEDWAVLVGRAVDAGPDQSLHLPQEGNQVAATLDGTVFMGADSYSVQWSFSGGPGSVVFADASSEDTTVAITGNPGLYTLWLTVTGGGTIVSNSMVIDVDAFALDGNVAPEFLTNSMSYARATATVDYERSLSGSAFDLNGDTLAYSKVTGPAWLQVSADGTLSGTPEHADVGISEFIVRVTDSEGASDTAALYIEVEPSPSVSRLLSAEADAYVQGGVHGNENYGMSTELLVKSDTGNLSFSRESYLRFDVSPLSSNASAKVTLRLNVAENYSTQPHVLFMVNDDQWEESTITWNDRPAASTAIATNTPSVGGWLEMDVTEAVSSELSGDGRLSLLLRSDDIGLVKYRSREAGADSAPHLLVESNSAPFFAENPIAGAGGTEGVAYTGTIGSLADDVNPDDTLTFAKVSGPAWLQVAADGTLSGTPGFADIGQNVFIVRVEDDAMASDNATLQISVVGNTAPVFAADPIHGGIAMHGTVFNGTLSASDPDAGNTLTYSKLSGPAWLQIASNGAFSGIPGEGDVGPNTFTVMVEDGLGASDTAMLNISVELAVSPPAITNIVDFILAQGYSDGGLKNNHADWNCQKNPIISDATGAGWAALDDGYGNNCFLLGVPSSQDAFTVSIKFRFTSNDNSARKPVINVGFYGEPTASSAEKLKASLMRDFANGVQIILEGSGWFEQLGFMSEVAPLSSVGLTDGRDVDSDLLLLTATLTRGATANDWAMTSKLYNLTTDPGATTPLIDYSQTSIAHSGLFGSSTIYGGFGGGQSDANSGTSNRRLDTFTFIGENFGGGSGWLRYVSDHGLSGIPSADSDGDGASDLYEYALGGNPTNAMIPPMHLSIEYGTNDIVRFYHPERVNNDAGILYHAQWCTNLLSGEWAAGWDVDTVSPTTDPEFNERRLEIDGSEKDSLFFRVVPALP